VLRDAQGVLLVLRIAATRTQNAEYRPRCRELRQPGDNRRIDAPAQADGQSAGARRVDALAHPSRQSFNRGHAAIVGGSSARAFGPERLSFPRPEPVVKMAERVMPSFYERSHKRLSDWHLHSSNARVESSVRFRFPGGNSSYNLMVVARLSAGL
jgi:hypothetical protein